MMNAKKTIFPLVFLFFLSVAFADAYSQENNVDSLFQKANTKYSEGIYSEAIQLYSGILEQGNESDQLYYNLGNAYFKTHDYPLAILNYERALRLNPGDEDIVYNLNIANTQIIDKIEEVPVLFYKKWWKTLLNIFDTDTWAILTLVFAIAFMLFLSLFILAGRRMLKKLGFWSALVFLFFGLLITEISLEKRHQQLANDKAIIFTPTVTVKSSPNKNSKDLFVIHEGTKVLIIDEIEEWAEIKISNGSLGWISKDDYQII